MKTNTYNEKREQLYSRIWTMENLGRAAAATVSIQWLFYVICMDTNIFKHPWLILPAICFTNHKTAVGISTKPRWRRPWKINTVFSCRPTMSEKTFHWLCGWSSNRLLKGKYYLAYYWSRFWGEKISERHQLRLSYEYEKRRDVDRMDRLLLRQNIIVIF